MKTNTYDVGKANISRIASIIEKVKKVFGDSYASCEYKDGSLFYEYLENAISFDDLLKNTVDSGDWAKVELLLQKWKSIIVGNANLVSFDNSAQFKQYFGTSGTVLEGESATDLSNLDCSAENILLNKDQNSYKVVDTEWVFDFTIPVEFIQYYTIRLFCKKHYDKAMLGKMLSLAGIKAVNCEKYDKMVAHFYDYISLDDKGIDYRTLGSHFLKAVYNDNCKETEYQYVFPVDVIPDNTRVAVYGAGDVGRDYVGYLKNSDNYKLSAWIDRNYERLSTPAQEIISPQQINEKEIDFVLLAVCNRAVAGEMKKTLLDLGVPQDKIYWDEKSLM
ncbi:hypothetical protein [Anaerovibrio lipolyticus]|uniref:hypothetical protein n=1 Tax=Anaerovibrio lipolyticus TaxID=82374 RepID=UPI0012DE5C7B|nr:hypothetical protein [Anaerovibrio lipolyticus]